MCTLTVLLRHPHSSTSTQLILPLRSLAFKCGTSINYATQFASLVQSFLWVRELYRKSPLLDSFALRKWREYLKWLKVSSCQMHAARLLISVKRCGERHTIGERKTESEVLEWHHNDLFLNSTLDATDVEAVRLVLKNTPGWRNFGSEV